MKAPRIFTSLAFALLLALPAAAQQPLTVPPVHRYGFGAAAAAAPAGTLALDSIGTAHAVVRGGGASFTGTGLRLPGGSSASAAYIDLPNGLVSGAAARFPGYASASYEVWVTVHSNQNWSRVLDFGSNQSGEITAPGGTFNGLDYLIVTANTGTAPDIRFERGGQGLTGAALQDSAGATPVGQKVHLLVTYEATAGAWRLYRNGALLKTLTSLLGPDTIPDANAWLGRSNWAGDANADATYDEFRIYDYALNDQQALGNFQAGPNTLTSPAPVTAPIVHYRFDETTGTTAADASGNGNPGALAGGAGFTAGLLGNAMNGNGSTSGAETANAITLPNPTEAMTLAAWIRPAAWSGGNRRVVQKGANDDQFRLFSNGTVLTFEIAGPVRAVTVPLPSLNVWTHVAGTYDGATLRLYVNGVEAASTPASGAIPTTADALFIGTKGAASPAGDRFSGLIDDVRIYERPLDAAAVNELATVASIAATDATAQVGTADGGTFAVTRTGSPASALPLSFTIGSGAGQAAPGTRYTLSPSMAAITIPAGQASATITVAPASDAAVLGTQTVTLNLASGAGFAVANANAATVQLLDSPVNAWKVQKFGSVAAAQAPNAADSADADGDGMKNLLEYLLVKDPIRSDAPGLVTAREGALLTLTYTRLKNAAGVTSGVKWSDDLATWSASGVTEEILADNGTTQTVKAKVSAGTGTKRFLMLQVVR